MACASEHCLVNASCDTNSEHFEILEQTESLSVSSYSSVSEPESEVVALRIKKREKLCFVPVSTKSGITPIPEDELNRMLMGNCDDRDPTPATDNSNALTDNHTQQPLNRGIRAEELNSCSQNENRNDARSENVLKRKRQGTDHFSPPLATKTFMKGKSTNKEHKRRKRIRWTKEMVNQILFFFVKKCIL